MTGALRNKRRTTGRKTRRPASPLGLDLDSGGRPVRVAIYKRISTDEEHQPFSLEAQDLKLRAYIGTQPGWELAATYSDQASGATTEREKLQAALAAAKAGRYDVLLVYRVDRLSRSLRGLVDILDELDDAGVAFRSATEPVDTSTHVGRMLVQMLGVFAQFERETIIDRVINGMERKAARGQWPGGYRPHGYELNRDTGMLQIIDAEAATVRMIFDLYVQDRIGAKAIATRLNNRGLRTKAGKPWSAQSVLVVLRNRVYLGEVYFRETWYRAEQHHEPVVDPEVFEQAQQLLIARGDEHTQRTAAASEYQLAGHIICSHCGKKYLGHAVKGNKYRYRYYTCFTRHRYGTDACPAERLPADHLEQAVTAAMLDIYDRPDLIGEAITAVATQHDASRDTLQAELDTLTKELAGIDAKIDRYLTAFETGDMPQHLCGPRIEALSQQATQLRDRREELLHALDAQPQAPTEADLAALRAAIRHALTSGEPGAIKRVNDALIHEIRVTARDQIKPTFRIPAQRVDSQAAKVSPMYGSVPPAVCWFRTSATDVSRHRRHLSQVIGDSLAGLDARSCRKHAW
ncbi:MAG: recombinase family protein, partial [Micromonosporaceae bacterium]